MRVFPWFLSLAGLIISCSTGCCTVPWNCCGGCGAMACSSGPCGWEGTCATDGACGWESPYDSALDGTDEFCGRLHDRSCRIRRGFRRRCRRLWDAVAGPCGCQGCDANYEWLSAPDNCGGSNCGGCGATPHASGCGCGNSSAQMSDTNPGYASLNSAPPVMSPDQYFNGYEAPRAPTGTYAAQPPLIPAPAMPPQQSMGIPQAYAAAPPMSSPAMMNENLPPAYSPISGAPPMSISPSNRPSSPWRAASMHQEQMPAPAAEEGNSPAMQEAANDDGFESPVILQQNFEGAPGFGIVPADQ